MTMERNPQAAMAARTSQFPRYRVLINSIDTSKVAQPASDPRGIAQTVDTFGRLRQIGVSTMVGSGAFPQTGETWLVDQSLGTWTFLSRVIPVTPDVVDLLSLAQALQQLGLVNYTGPPTETVQSNLTVLGALSAHTITATSPPHGTVIKQEMYVYTAGASLTGPQTNHGWYNVTFQKVRPDTVLNVALTGSSYISTAATLTTYNIQVQGSAIVPCAQFFFQVAATHSSWSGVAPNAGGLNLTGAVLVQTFWTFAGTGTMTTDANDKSTLTVTEVIPG